MIVAAGILGCTKENERPQWEVQVVGPVLHATLGVDNFIADSIIHVDNSHAISLAYENVIYESKIDSLFQIRDTVIPTVVTFPFTSFNLGANTPFYGSTNDLVMNIDDVELRTVILKSGMLHVSAFNRLQTRVIYTYSIPKAKLNGIPFQVSVPMNAAPAGGSTSFTHDYDMTGYTIDLTGTSGNTVNTLSYSISARTDTNSASTTIFMNDTLVNLDASLRNIVPYYAKGYLGQREINDGNTTRNFNPFGAIQSGNFRLKDITMKFIIENSIGIDAQAFLSSIQSFNSSTNTLVNLTAPSLVNHTININRATESGNPASPVNPTNYIITLDSTNSNIKAFIENLPDRLNYSMRLNTNPGGNISSSNDFVFSDYLLKVKLKVEMPLAFAADHLTLADTSAFEVQNKEDFDPVGAGTYTLIVDNGFPFEADVHLELLDENNQFVDSLPVTGPVAAAPVDASFKVIAPKRTKIPVVIDASRKQRILNAKNLYVRASFTTPAFPEYIRIYSDYKLKLKLVADATYLID